MSAHPVSPAVMHGITPDRYLTGENILLAYEAFTELSPVCSSTIATALFTSVVQYIRQGYTTAIQGHENIIRDLHTEHENAIRELYTKHENAIRALHTKHDNTIRELHTEHENTLRDRDTEHENTLRDRDTEHENTLRDRDTEHEKIIRDIRIELEFSELRRTTQQDACERDRRDLGRVRDDLRQAHGDLSRLRDDLRVVHGYLASSQSALLQSQNELHQTRFELQQAQAELNAREAQRDSLHEDQNDQIELMRTTMSAVLRLELNRLEVDQEIYDGSVSRSALWNKHLNLPGNRGSVILSSLNLPVLHETPQLQAQRTELLALTFAAETDMYEPFVDYLSNFLSVVGPENARGSFRCFNTYKNYYLETFAPDITISIPGVAVADAMAMSLFFELKPPPNPKHPEDSKLGSSRNLGQVLEYLLAAARCQHGRQYFAGILSNIHVNIVVVLFRSGESVHLRQYVGVDLVQTLQFLQMVIAQPEYQPPQLAFSIKLGPLLKRLGHPTHSIVAQFKFQQRLPPTIPGPLVRAKTMAVKRPKDTGVDALNKEIHFLTRIAREGEGLKSLPRLVYISDDRDEIGIYPVGTSLTATSLTVGSIARQVVRDVVTALKWLHDHDIIHCDVRADNVLVTPEGHGVLIDFDCSADAMRETLYKGGYICAPEEVWNNPQQLYWPRCSHDYLAVILMVNSLLFPHLYKHFHSKDVFTPGSIEVSRLKKLWDDMRASPVWSRWVLAAEGESDTVMIEIADLLVLL